MASPSTLELETAIGPRAFSGSTTTEIALEASLGHDTKLLGNMRLWLVKQGLPQSSVNAAVKSSMAKAYCYTAYLRAWRNKVNPSWALLENNDEDEMKSNSSANAITGIAAAAPPSPAAPIPAHTEQWLKDLYVQIEKITTNLIEDKLNRTTLRLDDGAKEQIRSLAKSAATVRVEELMPPRTIEIKDIAKNTLVPIGLQHAAFPTLLRAMQAKDHRGYHLNIWLTGPTGSGKTSAVESAAKGLGLMFEAEGSLDADYKIMGFYNANGVYVETAFFRRYTTGGVILLDEIDNYSPSALLAVNAATANSFCQFPCGHYVRHPDCIIIACANTWGLGATGDYVGRTRLDAASLDRFQPKIPWPVDEKLERAIAEQMAGDLGTEWHDTVIAARHRAIAQGLKIIISPRATFNGISLLKQGFTDEEVIGMTIAAGLSPEQVKSIGLSATSASNERGFAAGQRY